MTILIVNLDKHFVKAFKHVYKEKCVELDKNLEGQFLSKELVLRKIDEVCKNPTFDSKTATNIKIALKKELNDCKADFKEILK